VHIQEPLRLTLLMEVTQRSCVDLTFERRSGGMKAR
jgi:hypothetical protein